MAPPKLDQLNIPQPWGEADAHFEERAKASGQWRPFLLDRAVYRLRGLPPGVVHRLAQQHYPPDNFPIAEIKTAVGADSIGLSHRMTGLEVRHAMLDRLGVRDARSCDFDERKCSFSESMDWVAENLGVSVTRHDAPSRMAWSIYDAFKANRSEFYRLYLNRRYKPDAVEEEFDPCEGLSEEGEDIGLPRPFGVPRRALT